MYRNQFRESKLNLPKNTITFSHNDLDGVGVGIIVKSINGRDSEVHYCSYDNVDERINERLDEIAKNHTDSLPFILIADLGIKEATARRLNNYGGGVTLLDHHISNEEMADTYRWMNVDENACGTLQVFDHFAKSTKMEDFAKMVDDYDRWNHKDPRSKKHNQLFFMRSFEETEERWLTNPSLDFTPEEEAVLAMEARRIEKHFDNIEKVVEIFDLNDGQTVGIVYCDSYQSETGHEMNKRLGTSALIMIDANRRKLSLRSVPHFDVSRIAKGIGGGGHKNAAGCNLKGTNHYVEQALETVIENVFESFAFEHEQHSAVEYEALFAEGENQ